MAKQSDKAAADTTLAAQSMNVRDSFLNDATNGIYTAHRANGKADSAAYASLAYVSLMAVESIGRLQVGGRWEGETNDKAADSAFGKTFSAFLMHLAYKGFPVFTGADMSAIVRIKERDARIKAVREHFKTAKESKARKAKAIRNVQTLARKIVRHVVDNAGDMPRNLVGANDPAGAVETWRAFVRDTFGADMETVSAFFAGANPRESDWYVSAAKRIDGATFLQLDKLNQLRAAIDSKIAGLEEAAARAPDESEFADDSDAYTEESDDMAAAA